MTCRLNQPLHGRYMLPIKTIKLKEILLTVYCITF